MDYRQKLQGAAACLLLFAAQPAFAQTATDTFTVQITIQETCQIDSATNMDFGTVGILNNETATSTIDVTCTNGTPYDLGLDAGTGTGATVASRLMTGGGTETVEYSLYQENTHTTLWGETIGTDTVAATGDGTQQSYTVYGQLATQATPSVDTYTDTITVTLTY